MTDIQNLFYIHPHFREFGGQGESIYDYVQAGYQVPEQVITYLKIFNPILASGTMYEHPFIPGKRMAGKVYMTDGNTFGMAIRLNMLRITILHFLRNS